MKSSTKKATATTGSRAKTLKPQDRVSAKLAAEQQQLEETKREAKRAASKRWYQNKKKKAPSEQTTKPAAPTTTQDETISKTQLIAALEVHLAAERAKAHRSVGRIEGLETALGLARLLG